ncbi:hypothetical protein CIB95_01265 [Lottiidibacillus patelloidae]|uniref:Uncharacterized protein n=1 Tax=Lottiidibacillus patelloidae TaxID=2670334 RepID=A0A263BWV3_9BACI|nr:hypothetical protein [Lottiidibacillus patelloidae]OZM58231.1 hypothetical protein CIB95_01265 [Lottiidibacillus patelloidae]
MKGILISIVAVISVVLAIAYTDNPIKMTLNKIIEESEHPELSDIKDLAKMRTVTHFGKVESNLLEGVGDETGFQGFIGESTAFVVTKRQLIEPNPYIVIFSGGELPTDEQTLAQITQTVEGFTELVGKPEKIEIISTHEVVINNGSGEETLGTFYKVMFEAKGQGFMQKVLTFVNEDGNYIHTFSKGHKKLEDF